MAAIIRFRTRAHERIDRMRHVHTIARVAEPIPPVKGTRDFYPDDFAPIQWLVDAWRRVSLRHGFREMEGPTLEHIELFTRKSGQEIVEQLFTLTDRGGRELALRPEMTPTLARMVAARQGSLPRPIKWFSVPRLYRGERPQRGRLREFLQWNVDILGVAGPAADAECILVAVDGLREVGLTAADVAVHINDRRLMASLLAGLGIPEDRLGSAYALLDKVGKLPAEELSRRWGEGLGGYVAFESLWGLMDAASPDELGSRLASERNSARGAAVAKAVGPALEDARRLLELIGDYGILEYCRFDLRIVRGLAYYTGPVYEIYDRQARLRAICGGGRYDQLLEQMGGRPMPAAGFGMGDVVLLELLNELKRLPAGAAAGGVFVVDAAAAAGRVPSQPVARLVAALRRGGCTAEFAYEAQAMGKQLRRAAERGSRLAVIVGQETQERGVVQVKDLTSGQQHEVELAALMADPARLLGGGATVW
jgi:histidyl-tRNA synthetase